jgi:hypothetical protein
MCHLFDRRWKDNKIFTIKMVNISSSLHDKGRLDEALHHFHPIELSCASNGRIIYRQR